MQSGTTNMPRAHDLAALARDELVPAGRPISRAARGECEASRRTEENRPIGEFVRHEIQPGGARPFGAGGAMAAGIAAAHDPIPAAVERLESGRAPASRTPAGHAVGCDWSRNMSIPARSQSRGSRRSYCGGRGRHGRADRADEIAAIRRATVETQPARPREALIRRPALRPERPAADAESRH